MTRTSEPDFEKGTLNPYVVSGMEIREGDRYGYKVVLKIRENKYWCAYRGPTTWSDERIEQEGDAISKEAATILFPQVVAGLEYFGGVYYD